MKKKILLIGNTNGLLSNLKEIFDNENYELTLIDFIDTQLNFVDNDFKIRLTDSHLKLLLYNINNINFNNFNLIIGTGRSAMLSTKSNFILDIFIPAGGDIRWWTSYSRVLYNLNSIKSILYIPVELLFTLVQIIGLKKAKTILTHGYAQADIVMPRKILDKYKNIKPDLVIPTITEKYIELALNKNDLNFFKYMKNKDVWILCHARHEWNTDKIEPSNKGQDKLINGFAQFVKEIKNQNIKLVLLEYGRDVEYSKILIKKLNLDDYVLWFPKMHKRKLLNLVSVCDLVAAEMNLDCSYNGVHQETILLEKPLLAFRDLKNPWVNYSILNVNEKSVAELLLDFYYNPDFYYTKAKTNKFLLKRDCQKTTDFILSQIR